MLQTPATSMRLMADRLSALSARYDVLFCDIWGVLHGGGAAFPAAVQALQRFRAGGGTVVMVSNSPRPGEPLARQLLTIYRTPRDAFDAVISAGDVMVDALRTRPGRWHLEGPSSDLGIFDGLDVEFGPVEGARGVVMTQLKDGLTETGMSYLPLLRQMKAAGQVFVCGNADRIVEHGGKRYVCPGAVADEYQAIGGEVVWCGKPTQPIYDLAFRKVPSTPRARILAIGDGLMTDIAGANTAGIDVMFITGGIHGDELDEAGTARIATLNPNMVGLADHLAW